MKKRKVVLRTLGVLLLSSAFAFAGYLYGHNHGYKFGAADGAVIGVFSETMRLPHEYHKPFVACHGGDLIIVIDLDKHKKAGVPAPEHIYEDFCRKNMGFQTKYGSQ